MPTRTFLTGLVIPRKRAVRRGLMAFIRPTLPDFSPRHITVRITRTRLIYEESERGCDADFESLRSTF